MAPLRRLVRDLGKLHYFPSLFHPVAAPGIICWMAYLCPEPRETRTLTSPQEGWGHWQPPKPTQATNAVPKAARHWRSKWSSNPTSLLEWDQKKNVSLARKILPCSVHGQNTSSSSESSVWMVTEVWKTSREQESCAGTQLASPRNGHLY